MESIRFINSRGEAVDFYGVPFHLQSIEGLGDVDAENTGQRSPFQDGETYLDTLLDVRHIDLLMKIQGTNYEEIKKHRSTLARVTNPKLGPGTLQYKSGDIIREIEAIAESVPIFPSGRSNRGEGWQVCTISFKCPNPYWKSLNVAEEPAFEPHFRFPTKGPFIMGISRDRRIINNDGDAPSPLKVEFFGPALNPKIINNTTGEYIKVNQELLEGERMLIDTFDDAKSVIFVDPSGKERNVFPWIDLNSTFFKLQIGENDIEYTADSDIQGTNVNISYNKLYNAV